MTQILSDRINVNDSFNGSGNKIIGELYQKNKTPDGKTLFKKLGENKITIGLAQEIAKMMTNQTEDKTEITKLDEESALNLMNVVSQTNDRMLFGFGLSLDGGSENAVKPVKKYSKGYSLTNGLIPFRMVDHNNTDISLLHSNGYLIRDLQYNEELETDYSSLYVKRFDDITINNIQENGDPLPDNPSENLGVDVDVYSIIDLDLSISENDLAEYFSLIEGDIQNRRYNGITLFMGDKCTRADSDNNTMDSFCNIISTNRMNIRQRNIGEEGVQNLVYRIYV